MNEGLYPYTRRYLGTTTTLFYHRPDRNERGVHERAVGPGKTLRTKAQQFTVKVLTICGPTLRLSGEYATCTPGGDPAGIDSLRLCQPDVSVSRYYHCFRSRAKLPNYTTRLTLPVVYIPISLRPGCTGRIADTLHLRNGVTCVPAKSWPIGKRLPPVRKIEEKFQLPYYTLSPTIRSVKITVNLQETSIPAPRGSPAEVYSAITAINRPSRLNDGKGGGVPRAQLSIRKLQNQTCRARAHENEPGKGDPGSEATYLFYHQDLPQSNSRNRSRTEPEFATVCDAEENQELVKNSSDAGAHVFVVRGG